MRSVQVFLQVKGNLQLDLFALLVAVPADSFLQPEKGFQDADVIIYLNFNVIMQRSLSGIIIQLLYLLD